MLATNQNFGGHGNNDIFRVQRNSGVVTYWRNDVTFYTSPIPSTAEVFAGTSFFSLNTKISGFIGGGVPIPEPTTFLLLSIGLAGLAVSRKRAA